MVFEGQGEGKIGGVRVWNRECIIQNIRLLTIKTTLIQLRRERVHPPISVAIFYMCSYPNSR